MRDPMRRSRELAAAVLNPGKGRGCGIIVPHLKVLARPLCRSLRLFSDFNEKVNKVMVIMDFPAIGGSKVGGEGVFEATLGCLRST